MNDFFNQLFHEFHLPLTNPVLVFSVVLFIILMSPILLRKLNIPGIIGLIISGVIIGPHGLNVLEKNAAVDLFSTIGLLYIMFIAGLELDMHEFRIHRKKSFVFGFFTFAVPLAIGYPVCRYLLEFDFNASFLTASMFATHTLVAYPIVSKFNLTKIPAVAVGVGGTILTDTAVLIILAVILGNADGSLNYAFWLQLGISLIIFLVIMFAIIPRIAKWFFIKLESEKHSHYIFVLSVVFFAAFLAEVAGLEPIIGAFASGLALNGLIPHSSALMNRIEFIGNSLFIPFFLISVGMIVNVGVVMNGPEALIVAVTLSIVALVGKWMAAWFTQLSFGYGKAERQLIFGLSSAHAAATLAIILVGYKAGILNENILNGTILLILITCVVASSSTEKAAKKIIRDSENSSLEVIKSASAANEKILLPIANFDSIENLIAFSSYIKNKKSPHPISILTVVSNNQEAEINIVRARNKLEVFVREASASETQVNVLTTIDHNPASGISRVAREVHADIVIVGWPNKAAIIDKLLGEKIDSILDNTEKNVFVCHFEKPLGWHKRIVVAIPALAEHEKGFITLFGKLTMLAQELSIGLHVYCNEATKMALHEITVRIKISATLRITHFEQWDDFFSISNDIQPNDLIVLFCSRQGFVSYIPVLENLPTRLERQFPAHSRIAVYPQQIDHKSMIEGYEDFNSDPLNKGLETIQKIGNSIGSIFKKDENEAR